MFPAKAWSLSVGFTVFKPPPPTPVRLNPGNDQFETQTKVSRESPPGDGSLQHHHATAILSSNVFHSSGLFLRGFSSAAPAEPKIKSQR